MGMKSCPPDYSSYSIVDFEIDYEALTSAANAFGGVICQPRSTLLTGLLRPGGASVQRKLEQCQQEMDEIIDHLRTIRFEDDSEDDDRRLRLIARYELEFTDRPIEAILAPSVHSPEAASRAA